MKCQSLFFVKYKKNIKSSFSEFVQSVVLKAKTIHYDFSCVNVEEKQDSLVKGYCEQVKFILKCNNCS